MKENQRPEETKDYKELLEQYDNQAKEANTHSYSEVLHHDYSDYSEGCCC